MPIIIDGHNLLWSIQQENEDSGSLSDGQLCRIVDRFLQLTAEKGQIVFDGTGSSDKSKFDNMSNLEVFFAGLGTDADAVIEDKIRANTAPRRLTVVSSDRRLRDAARARRAISIKSETFWDNLRKELQRKKTVTEPEAKRRGITRSETKQWLKLFGLEQ
jgi:predicted RNA-binding protein with PIN domain